MLKRFLAAAALLAVAAATSIAVPSVASAAPQSATGSIWSNLPPQGDCGTLTTTGSSTVVGSYTVTAAPGGVTMSVALTMPANANQPYSIYQNCVGTLATGTSDAAGVVSSTFFVPASDALGADLWEIDGGFPDGTYFRGEPVHVTPGGTTPPPPAQPTTKDDCKNGGWKSFPGFKNQGDCVSFVATHGRNAAAA